VQNVSGDDGPWVDLFNGRDLDGWTARHGPRQQLDWAVQDGNLIAHRGLGAYCTNRTDYQNFVLHVEAMLHLNGDMHIELRTQDQAAGPQWYSFDIDGAGDNARAAAVITMHDHRIINPLARVTQPAIPINQWFPIDITVKSSHITIKSNDVTLLDGEDANSRYARGAIGLGEIMGNMGTGVMLRKVQIRELPQ
jgi:hypothetical protein